MECDFPCIDGIIEERSRGSIIFLDVIIDKSPYADYLLKFIRIVQRSKAKNC